jgi:hypothetical protein
MAKSWLAAMTAAVALTVRLGRLGVVLPMLDRYAALMRS